MNPSKTSSLETEVSELKKLVNNLLDKVNKLTTENTSLREELRDQKKLKGQPKIRPGKKNSESSSQDKSEKPASDSGILLSHESVENLSARNRSQRT